jgi:hypothetical protein
VRLREIAGDARLFLKFSGKVLVNKVSDVGNREMGEIRVWKS